VGRNSPARAAAWGRFEGREGDCAQRSLKQNYRQHLPVRSEETLAHGDEVVRQSDRRNALVSASLPFSSCASIVASFRGLGVLIAIVCLLLLQMPLYGAIWRVHRRGSASGSRPIPFRFRKGTNAVENLIWTSLVEICPEPGLGCPGLWRYSGLASWVVSSCPCGTLTQTLWASLAAAQDGRV
jgi:hypothetical protein